MSFVRVNVFVLGSNISALEIAISDVPSSRKPPAISTLPSGRSVAECAARSTFIWKAGERQSKYGLAVSAASEVDSVGDALSFTGRTSAGREAGEIHPAKSDTSAIVDNKK